MLICPAATARLLTDRLPVQLWLSVGIGGATGAGGYLLGAFGPTVLMGEPADALNAAGMIATLAGVLLTAAILFAPRHGILGRRRSALRLGPDDPHGAERNDVVSNAVTR